MTLSRIHSLSSCSLITSTVRLLLAFVAAHLFLLSASASANLVANGDFESGNVGFITDYVIPLGVEAGTYGVYDSGENTGFFGAAPNDHTTGTGMMMLANGSGMADDVVWGQDVTVSPNTIYQFSMWAMTLEVGGSGDNSHLEVLINGTPIGPIFSTPLERRSAWIRFSAAWDSGTSTVAQIRIFERTPTTSGVDFGLDDISLQEVPISEIAGPLVNPSNGHRYFLLDCGGSWTTCELAARSYDGHLVTINDPGENAWVFNTFSAFSLEAEIPDCPCFWIGYTDAEQEGAWRWASGEIPGFENWSPGEPSNHDGLEHYAHLWGVNHTNPGTWNDSPESGVGYAVVLPYGIVEVGPKIAYHVPADEPGNQDTTGYSLGLDFDVLSPIEVTSLGVFDSNGDGITGTLLVVIFDRNTQLTVTPTLTFTGTSGTLDGSSRFRGLSSPITLPIGSYSVVSWGYGSADLNGNSTCVGFGGAGCLPGNPFTLSTMEDGGGLIAFVGTGRWGLTSGGYPPNPDAGPANKYHAGNFQFQATAHDVPSIELPGLVCLATFMTLVAGRFLGMNRRPR